MCVLSLFSLSFFLLRLEESKWSIFFSRQDYSNGFDSIVVRKKKKKKIVFISNREMWKVKEENFSDSVFFPRTRIRGVVSGGWGKVNTFPWTKNLENILKRVSTRRENREISGNFRLAATSQHGGLARSSSTIVFSFFSFFFSSPLPSFFPSSFSLPIRVSIDHGSRHVTTRLEFQLVKKSLFSNLFNFANFAPFAPR